MRQLGLVLTRTVSLTIDTVEEYARQEELNEGPLKNRYAIAVLSLKPSSDCSYYAGQIIENKIACCRTINKESNPNRDSKTRELHQRNNHIVHVYRLKPCLDDISDFIFNQTKGPCKLKTTPEAEVISDSALLAYWR